MGPLRASSSGGTGTSRRLRKLAAPSAAAMASNAVRSNSTSTKSQSPLEIWLTRLSSGLPGPPWPATVVRPRPVRSAVALVVRRLARDADAVRMAFGHSCSRHAHEARTLAQGFQVLCTDVAHPGAQATNQLVQHPVDGALVGDLTLDALRYELEGVLDLLLEIAVGTAACHGPHRAHTAVGFVGATLIKVRLPRGFVCARK